MQLREFIIENLRCSVNESLVLGLIIAYSALKACKKIHEKYEEFEDELLDQRKKKLDRERKKLDLEKAKDKQKELEAAYKADKEKYEKDKKLAESQDRDKKELEKSNALMIKCRENMSEEDKKKFDKDYEGYVSAAYSKDGTPKPFKESAENIKNDKELSKAIDDAEESRDLESAMKEITDKDIEKSKEHLKSVAERVSSDKDDDKEVKKDKDGNTLQDEEIDDPDNPGKKMKVTWHVGPRGGRFYYVPGKPKTDDHKVYGKKK